MEYSISGISCAEITTNEFIEKIKNLGSRIVDVKESKEKGGPRFSILVPQKNEDEFSTWINEYVKKAFPKKAVLFHRNYDDKK